METLSSCCARVKNHLEPYFDLALGEAEGVGYLNASPAHDDHNEAHCHGYCNFHNHRHRQLLHLRVR